MKSLIAYSLLLCSDGSRQALEEDSSLMQGLLARHNQLSVSETQNTTKEARKDAATKLMETATNMMKSGVTPDIVTFIETTITEVNRDVLGVIVEEHHRDQTLINNLLAQFDDAIAIMEACAASVNQEHVDRTAASLAHRTCRSGEALDCARSRKCEEELEQLWSIVKVEEEEMRRLHWAIHGEWCVGPAPPHPGLGDPFNWVPEEYSEGPETSQSIHPYPAVDLTANVIEFRSFSVEYFGHYMAQKPLVELAWNNYNTKLLECAELEETLETKVEQCDTLQVTVHDQACAHASTSRACASQFGRQYHMTLVSYNQAVETIRQLEYDRKREWETLHIVTCLLETVYTRVIHSIDSGEPCPTEESHPDQTTSEINECHIISESMTANLTIDYGNPPEPPDLPTIVAPPCTARYLWDEHGSFPSGVQTSHTQAIEDEGLGSYFTALSVKGWAGCAAPRACITCGTSELLTDDSYVDNNVCKEHQQHLHPGQLDLDSFKCLSGDECIRSSGRCNDVSNCADGSDELNCETSWGVAALLNREECQEPFVSDVQFRCLDSACIPVEGKCNGVNNCADGSDESGCVAGTTGVTLEPTTGLTATIETPALQSTVFYDRQYTFDSLGSFTGYSYVKMSNDDKHIRHSHVQMKLRLPQPTVVYVVKLDDYELPWLEADGWAISSAEGVSYHGIRQTRHTDWSGVLEEDHYGPGVVLQKTFTAGTVEMRGNNGGDGSYLIFVANPANPPSQSTDLWQRHLPDAGRVKCNLNVDLHYVADQAACQQLAVSNGHPFYSFRHNGQSQGHKCMSSATCDSPLTGRSNEWYMYQSAASNGAAEYVGCFVDDGARDLGTMRGGTGNAATNTFALCRATCGNTRFMSLQYGGECFCAESHGPLSTYPLRPDSECNRNVEPCSSTSHNCGGSWRQAIYEINPSSCDAVSTMGGGIHTDGVPDGASAIQFIDLGAGAMTSSGSMQSVRYRVARANQAGMKFQIYRPVSGNTYNLVMESEALASPDQGSTTTHQLATPLEYQAGDYIGWVHTGQGTFNFRGSGGNVRWRYGIQGVGSNIDFNGQGGRVYSYEATMAGC